MRSAQSGHNLLEMIVAVFIFSFVAIGVVSIWVMHYKSMEKANGRLAAQFLASELTEQCVAAGWQGVDTLQGSPENFTLKETVRDVPKEVQYTSAVLVENRTPRLKEVTVRVLWRESGRTGKLEYKSLLAKNG